MNETAATPDSIPEDTNAPVRVSESDRLASLLNRGYGIYPNAAKLMPLQLVGAIAGRSLIAQTIDGVVCSAGFNLAIVGSEKPMTHWATMELLDGVRAECETAKDREAAEGRQQTRCRNADLVRRQTELGNELRAAEEELAVLTRAPKTVEEIKAFMSACRDPLIRSQTRKSLEASVATLTKEFKDVAEELLEWKFSSAAAIVRDGESWENFPIAGFDSFDGHFLQIGTATSLLHEAESFQPKWFRTSTELLRRSRMESPFSGTVKLREHATTSVQINGDVFSFSRLFHDSRFSKTGFFTGFLLVESDAEKPSFDMSAMDALHSDQKLRLRLALLLNDRLCEVRHRLKLDRAGVQACLDFREWYLDFMGELPQQHHWSFSGWPNLLVQMALGMAIMEDKAGSQVLDVSLLQRAAELLKGHAPRQSALLDTMLPQMEVRDLFTQRLERLTARLIDKGPMRRRELARTISGQDYGVIDTLLAEGRRRGLVYQSGELFYAAGVNVNGTAGNPIVDFQGGVAA